MLIAPQPTPLALAGGFAPTGTPTPTPSGWGTATVALTNNSVDTGSAIANAYDGNNATDLIFAVDRNGRGAELATPAILTHTFSGAGGDIRQVRVRRSATFGSTNNYPQFVALDYSTDGTSWTQKGSDVEIPFGSVAAGAEGVANFNTAAGTFARWRVRFWSPFNNRMGFAEIVLAETVGGAQVVVL